MHRILFTCRETMIAAILLVPLFLILNKYRFRNTKRTILFTLFALYLCAVYAVVGLPNVLYFRFDPKYNIIPFLYMFSDLDTTLLNVLLFVPLGFFLPVLWKDFHSPVKVVLFGFFLSALIELLQIFTFRATDVNDLITNSAGTLIGYAAAYFSMKFTSFFVPEEGKQNELLVIGIPFSFMFFLQPFLSGLASQLLS